MQGPCFLFGRKARAPRDDKTCYLDRAVDRPLFMKLVRHGQSLANVNAIDPQQAGDFRTPLTDLGLSQARTAGESIGHDFVAGSLVYLSPYWRTRQTLDALLEGAQATREQPLSVYEDPRLREQDHGYGNIKDQEQKRATHGWFYYRYEGGESPADCYDRTSGFLESMMRQMERRDASRVIIVTHGMALRCFVMRFMRLSIEEFEEIDNPENGAVVTIGPKESIPDSYMERGAWRVSGLKRRA